MSGSRPPAPRASARWSAPTCPPSTWPAPRSPWSASTTRCSTSGTRRPAPRRSSASPMAGPTALDAAATRAWIDAFVAGLAAEREALGDLDRRSGDGDYGNNLKTPLDKAAAEVAAADTSAPRSAFTAVSPAFLGTGGTSGRLYGMWFRSIAALAEERGGLDLAALAEGTAAGLAS